MVEQDKRHFISGHRDLRRFDLDALINGAEQILTDVERGQIDNPKDALQRVDEILEWVVNHDQNQES